MLFDFESHIKVTEFGHVSHSRGHWHKGNRLDCHLILYLTDGKLEFEIAGKAFMARAGDIVFVPKETAYRPLYSEGCTYYFFHFEADECIRSESQVRPCFSLKYGASGSACLFGKNSSAVWAPDIHFTPPGGREIIELLANAAKLDFQDDRQKILLDAYFRQFVVLTQAQSRSVGSGRKIGEVLLYIRENITLPLSLSNVAAHFHFSPSYLARLFRQELGVSVGTYIARTKTEEACSLLINTAMTVSEIALHLGFSSPYYFSTCFSAQVGCSPATFRKNHVHIMNATEG